MNNLSIFKKTIVRVLLLFGLLNDLFFSSIKNLLIANRQHVAYPKKARLLITSFLVIFLTQRSNAQQYIYAVTTTVANAFPLGDATNNERQNIYYPSDFPTAPAGMITTVYYQPSTSTTYTFTNLTIKIGYTSLSTFSSGPWATGLTTCYSGTASFSTNSSGWIAITLQTPFFYNGTQNFIVDVSQGGFSPAMSTVCDNSTAATNRTLYGSSSSTTPSLQARLMRLGFDLTPGTPCNAPAGLTASGITGSGAVLSWGAVSGSQGYEYVLDQVATSPSGSGTPTSLTSYNASGLSINTTYYMHVRNQCSSTSFSSWVTTPFTTLSFVSCFAPATVTTSNMTSSMATINWSAVTGSQGYEYLIDQMATAPTGGWSSVATNSVSVTGLTGGTGYYAHIRNVCQATDKSAWVNYPFTTPTCNMPTNILVGNITDSSADVLWSQMPNAGKYEYAVDFSNQDPVSGIQNTTSITTHLTGLFPNSKYYIHVRSRCFTTDSSGWRLDSFITTMSCYAPSVQVNFLGTNAPYAFWAPVPTAIAYEYELNNNASDPAFGIEIYNTFINLTLPDDGKDYYLHVRAKCNSMFTMSKWSTVALRTGATGISTVNNKSVSIYPNPVKDVLHVTGADNMPYRITDVAGRTLLSGRIDESTGINTTALLPGLYLLTIAVHDAEQQYRFVK